MTTVINFDPITQGSNWKRVIQISDELGSPVDLTGCTAAMQFRSQYHGVIYADMTTENGLIAIGGTDGTITLQLYPANTAALAMRTLIYDFDFYWPDGRLDTLFKGTVTVNFEVTLPSSVNAIDFSDENNSAYIVLIL